MGINLFNDCKIIRLSSHNNLVDFKCKNADLNDFFLNDALMYQNELLGETFFFKLLTSPFDITCAFTLSNDSIRIFDLPGSRKKKIRKDISREKYLRSFPAALIGRLGVTIKYEGTGIGSQLLNFIKSFCLIEYGSRC